MHDHECRVTRNAINVVISTIDVALLNIYYLFFTNHLKRTRPLFFTKQSEIPIALFFLPRRLCPPARTAWAAKFQHLLDRPVRKSEFRRFDLPSIPCEPKDQTGKYAVKRIDYDKQHLATIDKLLGDRCGANDCFCC